MRHRHLLKLMIASVLGITMFSGCAEFSANTNWKSVDGHIEKIAIRVDHDLETKWGSQVVWRADFAVTYLVNGHRFTTNADSGIRAESQAEVESILRQTHPACVVKYPSAEPERASVKCKGEKL